MTDTFNCEINLLRALDWKRSNDEVLKGIIQAKQDWYQANHCDFWNDWVKNVFDLDAADDFGLSVWSIILDEPIYGLTAASPTGFKAWGFGPNRKNFNNGNFGTNDDSGFNFTTEQRRIILKLKAYILHMSGPAYEINKALKSIFGEGKVICIDGFDMTYEYVFYDPARSQFAIELKKRNLLPRPAGIEVILTTS